MGKKLWGATLFLSGIVVGALVGGSVATLLAIEYFAPASSIVYTATREIRLENGGVLPAGTDFVQRAFMPEGFESLCLGINVESSELRQFARREEPKSRLFIPYWVISSD